MHKQKIEFGPKWACDKFEAFKEDLHRYSAMECQIVVRAGRIDIQDQTIALIYGVLPVPGLEADLQHWNDHQGIGLQDGVFSCQIFLHHFESGEAGKDTGAWTEVEMFHGEQVFGLEEMDSVDREVADAKPPVIPAELLAMNPEQLKAFVDHFNDKDLWKGPNYPKMNLRSISIGYEEGEACNREGCKGIIEIQMEGSCICNAVSNPPCSNCTNNWLGCPVCGWESREEETLTPDQQQEGMILFQPQGDLGKFQEAYFNEITLLNIEDRRILNNILFSIWEFGNHQWSKGQAFGREGFLLMVELFTKAGDFATTIFPDATPAIHLKKLIREAEEGIQAPEDVEEYADMAIALFAAIFKSGIGLLMVMEAGLAKIEKVKKLDWLKLEDGTYQSIKPPQVPDYLKAVGLPKNLLRCPEGITAFSSECGELDLPRTELSIEDFRKLEGYPQDQIQGKTPAQLSELLRKGYDRPSAWKRFQRWAGGWLNWEGPSDQ